MKKIFTLILAGVMAFSIVACGKETTTEPENDTMPENMASMVAPVDALARCMVENNLEYNPEDPEVFWIALYYFTGGYGLNHPMVSEDENTYQLNVPSFVMEEHASVLFAEFDHLFDLPSIMTGNISYNPDYDMYYVSEGDIGLSKLQFTDCKKTSDGYKIRAELIDVVEEELIQAFDVTLVENPNWESTKNPLYFYSVKDIVPVGDKAQTGSGSVTETALFNGLADSHTAELTLPDGTVQAFQFDAASETAKIMGSLKEGDGITIRYHETENGSLMIDSVE